MLVLTTACAGIFILAICRAPGSTLALAALVLLVQAKQVYDALATKMQEMAAKYETTVAELREHISTIQAECAWNRALTEENRDYINRSLTMQDFIHTLSKDLSEAREAVDQHGTTIVDLRERNLGLESTIKDKDEQISKTAEGLNQEVTQGKAAIFSLQ
ncbi:hypothetical protein H1R20_g12116, partial [Candolleomyces eurysporus]